MDWLDLDERTKPTITIKCELENADCDPTPNMVVFESKSSIVLYVTADRWTCFWSPYLSGTVWIMIAGFFFYSREL